MSIHPESRPRVANPPSRPTLIYDGGCRFCRCQIERWKRRTGGHVDYVASDSPDIRSRFNEMSPGQFDRSLQLIMPDGQVFSGAHGALKALSTGGNQGRLLRLYESNRLCATILELGYGIVASNRGLFSRLSPCARRLRRR